MQQHIGNLTEIKQAETLLIYNKVVHRIIFVIGEQRLSAVSDEGTAFYFLQYDQRFREGTAVRCWVSAGLCVGIGFADDPREPIWDITELKDKAQANLNLKVGELHALYNAFDGETPQAYAIAVQLRRQHRDRTYPVGDKVCRCDVCASTFDLDSPRYTYRYDMAWCAVCGENVNFSLVDALPRARDERDELSWQDVQDRLKAKFGG